MSADSATVHDVVARRLRDAGQIYTSGRRQLVDLLVEFGRPATVPDLLEQRPKLTQSSMYRNMVDLEAAGVVQKVLGTDDRTRFELAESIIGHHHHLVCIECGAVDDFVVSPASERVIESALHDAIEASGFQPTGHRLDVLGRCARCA